MLKELAGRVDRAMADYCDRYLVAPERLAGAMRYSLEAGGKRIRPVLAMLSAQVCGGRMEDAMMPATAIEMIHTFSLIHDDLPAMDNDDFRRGRPTNHKVYGEAMAILAGDALLAFAFELIGTHYEGTSEQKAMLLAELAQATGPGGMTGGQVLDMDFAESKKELAGAEEVHRLKTAALIRCACRLGAICAGASKEKLEAVGEYGLKLGLAFQVIDDYLDVTSSEEAMGKGVGKDAALGKPNYAVLTSPDRAWARASELIGEAKKSLEIFNDKARMLQELATMMLKRKS
jgi:geranylgeranyl diphosphate synthase type II